MLHKYKVQLHVKQNRMWWLSDSEYNKPGWQLKFTRRKDIHTDRNPKFGRFNVSALNRPRSAKKLWKVNTPAGDVLNVAPKATPQRSDLWTMWQWKKCVEKNRCNMDQKG